MRQEISTKALKPINFQRLFESAPGFYVVLRPDEKFTIAAVSDKYLEIIMAKREDIIGKGLFEILPDNPADPEALGVRNLHRSLENVLMRRESDSMAVQRYDLRRPGVSGFEECYWSSINSPVLGDDRSIDFIIHRIEDVTSFVKMKQGRAEETRQSKEMQVRTEGMEAEIYNRMQELQRAYEALEASNSRYSTLTEMLPVGVFHADLEGNCLFVNPCWCEMTGQTSEKIINKAWYAQIHPEDQARILEEWRLLAETSNFKSEFRLLLPDGQQKWVFAQIVPQLSSFKKSMAYVGSITDITVRKQEEERRVVELAKTAQARIDFFGNVCHEFRTLLTLILGALEDSLKDEKYFINQEYREQQNFIYKNSLRLLKLINSLLDFSRVEVDRMKAVFDPIDFSEVTKELANVFRPLFERAGLEFIIDAPPLDERVYIDTEMYEKIVFNLLSNAFKYTLSGFVKLSVKKNDDSIELRVQDSGVGIPPEEIPHLFERFYRIKTIHGRNIEGSGIGLALTKQLAGLHGAKIEVESEPAKGSVFIVKFRRGKEHLPSDQIGAIKSSSVGDFPSFVARELSHSLSMHTATDSVASVLGAESGVELSSRKTILIVDDDYEIRNYLKVILSPYWQVIEATDVEEALALIKAKIPDLILCDILMPKVNGYEFVKQLKANEATRFIPVIFLSAKAGAHVCVEALNAGADDYMPKPFSPEELLGRIKTHLTLGGLRIQLEEQVQKLQKSYMVLKTESAERIRLEKKLAEEHSRVIVAEEYREKQSNFIDTLCHEIRNPLNAIYGSIPVLLDIFQLLKKLFQSEGAGLDAEISNKFYKYLQEAESQVEAMSYSARHQKVLVDDILNLSKLDSGKFEFNPTPFELKQLIDLVYSMFKKQLEQKKLNFNLSLPEENLYLKADTHRLSQVLINLMSNAIKFTQEGSIDMSIVAELLSESETMLHFSIKDTGEGMTPDEVSRLFDRFSQANRLISARHNGSGLGLEISKKIIEKMGGSIKIVSKKSEGTCVNFSVRCARLTLAEKMKTQAECAANAGLTRAVSTEGIKGKRILVVEDEEVNRKILIRLLLKAGCICEGASNGEKAIKAFQKSEFDLVITDIEMPIMGGMELVRHIRELEKSSMHRTPIIGCSGYTRDEIKARALCAGMDDYFTKPYEAKEVYRLVEKCITKNKEALKSYEKLRSGISASVCGLMRLGSPVFSPSIIPKYGLFAHSHPDNVQAEALLTGYAVAHDLKPGEALGLGDCFFDAMAQSLNRMHGVCYNVKLLRLLCDNYAKEAGHDWLKPALLADRDDYDDYLSRIRFTAEELERAGSQTAAHDRLAVWGRPSIEGRMMCEKLGIKIHTVEIQPLVEGEHQSILIHHEVDSSGEHGTNENAVDYNCRELMHLAVYNNHFVSLIPKQVSPSVAQQSARPEVMALAR